jgi:hypothetical protein
MPEHAKVTSLESLDSFRSSLIVYLEKAGRALDEVSDEVTRMRLWLETDRRLYWDNQVKRRKFALERAEEELSNARFSNFASATPQQKAAVERAKRALIEAEEKVKIVKHWIRQYDSRVEPPAKEVDKLRNVLVQQMSKAVHFLTQTVKTLAAYADLVAPTANAAPAPPAAPETPAAPGAAPAESSPPTS